MSDLVSNSTHLTMILRNVLPNRQLGMGHIPGDWLPYKGGDASRRTECAGFCISLDIGAL